MDPNVDEQLAGPTEQAALRSILSIIRQRTGLDFACYRAATIQRRVRNRMMSVGLSSLEQYRDLLDQTDSEALRLVERLTIKVSRFYRHAPTFDCLRHHLLPQLAVARKGKPLRVWSIGCGCGEEAYTLAMLLDELGAPGVVEATDIDPIAIVTAQVGQYPQTALEELPVELAARYLEPTDRAASRELRAKEVLRRRVRFSLHNIIAGGKPPGDGVFDLICCRNVLIYLQHPVQERIIAMLRDMIEGTGVLCLGEAEWPPQSMSMSLRAFPARTRLFQAIGTSEAAIR